MRRELVWLTMVVAGVAALAVHHAAGPPETLRFETPLGSPSGVPSPQFTVRYHVMHQPALGGHELFLRCTVGALDAPRSADVYIGRDGTVEAVARGWMADVAFARPNLTAAELSHLRSRVLDHHFFSLREHYVREGVSDGGYSQLEIHLGGQHHTVLDENGECIALGRLVADVEKVVRLPGEAEFKEQNSREAAVNVNDISLQLNDHDVTVPLFRGSGTPSVSTCR